MTTDRSLSRTHNSPYKLRAFIGRHTRRRVGADSIEKTRFKTPVGTSIEGMRAETGSKREAAGKFVHAGRLSCRENLLCYYARAIWKVECNFRTAQCIKSSMSENSSYEKNKKSLRCGRSHL